MTTTTEAVPRKGPCDGTTGLTHLIASALWRCESIARSRRLRRERGGFAATANLEAESCNRLKYNHKDLDASALDGTTTRDRFPVLPVLTVPALLLALALALSACAGAQKRGGATTAPLPSARTGASPMPSAPVPAAAFRQQADAAALSGKKAPAPARPDTKEALSRKSAVWRMLQSAGRDPDAPQPEEGFTLRVPASIGDGEAFPVTFAAEGAKALTVSWRGKSVSPGRQGDSSGPFQVLLPVPLDEQAKSLPLALTVQWDDGRAERFAAVIPVVKRAYPVQRLRVDQKFVTPPPEVREKIRRDREEMRAAISGVSPWRRWTLPLLRPVPGEVTSLYGSRRVFNGQPKSPHKGVDFDAKEGDPVAAVEGGVVVLAADHYYGGKTVVIDHGLGVFSAYLHLSAFTVSPGQNVARGDTVGQIGSTGRVTGPHLHLSLYVLGESVNAAACIAM